MPSTLTAGAILPHFVVTTPGGERFAYASIWQRRHLVLITLPRADAYAEYQRQLAAASAGFAERSTQCVLTSDAIAGVPAPAALIADRWGEVVSVIVPGAGGELPPPGELLEWLEYLETKCPECEGESR